MAQGKITVQPSRDSWDKFERLMKMLGFRRDAYLNRVLPGEVSALSEQETSCDDAGAAYLVDQFRGSRSHRRPVTLRLDSTLIEQLNRVCLEKRVVRDLFLEYAIRFVSARIEPATMLILEPRAADRTAFAKYARACENLADTLDYGELLIYDREKVERGTRVMDELLGRSLPTRSQLRSAR
jgi:hypothetical protein